MPARSLQIDELDRRIVACLQQNARMSFGEIGVEVGLSASAVKRRVDRLHRDGVLIGYIALVDPASLGWTTEAYVELYCAPRTSPVEILNGLTDYPEIMSAATVTGDADALLHVRATDIQHFERVVERISAQPHVERTRTTIVLSRLLRRPDAEDPPPT